MYVLLILPAALMLLLWTFIVVMGWVALAESFNGLTMVFAVATTAVWIGGVVGCFGVARHLAKWHISRPELRNSMILQCKLGTYAAIMAALIFGVYAFSDSPVNWTNVRVYMMFSAPLWLASGVGVYLVRDLQQMKT